MHFKKRQVTTIITEKYGPYSVSLQLLSTHSENTVQHIINNRVANRPEFFGTVPNSDAVSRVPNGSVRDRLMTRIFTEQKSNVNNDPYFRCFACDL